MQRECGGREHAFRRAAGAEEDVDPGAGLGGGDDACNIAVADQRDAGAGFADLGDGFGVAVTIEHADHQLGDIHALGAGEVFQVFGERGVERYHVFRQAAADRDLLHVDVRRVQKIAALGQRNGGDGVRAAFGGDRGAFQRVHGDVHRRAPLADFLADIEHRRFIHLAFADDDGAVDGDGVEGLAHGFNGRTIGFVFLAAADPARGGDGGGFGDADEFEGQIAI